MATLAQLRTQVRRDLHDLPIPQEQSVNADSATVVYSIPTLGPLLSGTLSVDVDGTHVDPSNYTLYELGHLQFNTPPVGSLIHCVFQYARYSNEDLNQWLQEAVREFSIVNPKQNNRMHTPVVLSTAHLTLAYTPGDGQFTVDNTATYDARGILLLGFTRYLYTSTDATHYLGVTVWAGPDAVQGVGTTCICNDNDNHGWVLDPTVVRYVYQFYGYEPPDAFGIGQGFQETAYFDYDDVSGYLHVEFDFGGSLSSTVDSTQQFNAVTGEYYAVPVNDTDVLELPDYALNPISWLCAALAEEARESDRDFAWKEKGNETTADPVLTYQRAGAANRKKWEDWVKTQFRPVPRSRRRRFFL